MLAALLGQAENGAPRRNRTRFEPLGRRTNGKEYVREGKAGKVHTNTLEGFFSIFKRGMVGTYQHCGEQHLQRYLAEFDFRMNHRAALGVDDTMRAVIALKGINGKRLTYRRTNAA